MFTRSVTRHLRFLKFKWLQEWAENTETETNGNRKGQYYYTVTILTILLALFAKQFEEKLRLVL